MASVETGTLVPSIEQGLHQTTSVVPTTETGSPIKVHKWPCSVTLSPAAAASGSVQYTTSSHATIDAGTAKWTTWANGVVSINTTAYAPGPITGVRGVSVSGIVTIEVVQ